MTSTSTPSRADSSARRWQPAFAQSGRMGWRTATDQIRKGPGQGPVIDAGKASSRKTGASRLADEDLVAASRLRIAEPLAGRDWWTSTTLAALFVATAAIMAAWLPPRTSSSIPVAVLLVLGLAVASRIEFEVGRAARLEKIPTTWVRLLISLCNLSSGLVECSLRRCSGGKWRWESRSSEASPKSSAASGKRVCRTRATSPSLAMAEAWSGSTTSACSRSRPWSRSACEHLGDGASEALVGVGDHVWLDATCV
jgi:hypothetical protein